MKKGLAYFLGILTGIALTLLVVFLLARWNDTIGVSYYDEPGDVLSFRSVTAFQALSPGTALVKESGHTDFDDQIYLLQLKENRALYDGEIVKAPTGTNFRIVGVYSYETNGGIGRTVPVITIINRKEK